MKPAIDLFHPLINAWFRDQFKIPTDIQEKAWPAIADNHHVLITAPTGSGKTLTAFLWAVNQLVTGQLPCNQSSVLYISPLKALNNDIHRNLKAPLEQLKERFLDAGEPFPDIRVLTRSGDTPQEERRKMVRRPPEILITTPESLNLMLSSKSGRSMLHHLAVVILDEIHAVVGTKRGVHLITAVDRLVRLSGEFQRISLSATVKEYDAVQQFIGGFMLQGSHLALSYQPRDVKRISSAISKQYRIRVKYPEQNPDREDNPETESIWHSVAGDLADIAGQNRSTLFFTNSRRLCEKLTFKVNKLAKEPIAYSHHGSLSKQLRHDVEQKLKNGDLKAIVATSSLEMGIDIGDLDEVVQIQSPPSISATVQRIGRAGHHVGEESRGTIFPAHPHDLIHSAVLAKAVNEQDIEPLTPVLCPLDVLAQILISMTGIETWDMDELYAWIRTSLPYHDLSRQQFDLVLNMLAGKYADSRVRELKPRISIDRLDNTVTGKKGALLALYMSGGTIPDRGYYQLRHQETNARIGELDEEYVWEAKIGQIATFGTQNWKIGRITHNDVFALPVSNRTMDAPFWRAEDLNRDFHFSQRISLFLELADGFINSKKAREAYLQTLETDYRMETPAAERLIEFLAKQKETTGTDLPHHHHLVLEYVRSGPDSSPGSQVVIHTLWGGRLNRPYALALEAAWEQHFREKPEIFAGNDAIVIQLARQIDPEKMLSFVTAANIEPLLRRQLENSGFFGARFRECAGRALLVTRNKINQRMPLWMTRLKSQKLMESVLGYEDFPILLETWRTCFQDEFDMVNLLAMLNKLDSGQVTWSVAHTSRPSPFAANMAWNQINQYMYQEDQPASSASKLGSDLFKDLVFQAGLRPMVSQETVDQFERKRQRLENGYEPQTIRDLVDWVKERVAIPAKEWEPLLNAVITTREEKDRHIALEKLKSRLLIIVPEQSNQPLIVPIELLNLIFSGWYYPETEPEILDLDQQGIDDASINQLKRLSGESSMDDPGLSLLIQWFQFYGPKPAEFISQTLGIPAAILTSLLNTLIESREWIYGELIRDQEGQRFCDAENFEILLRISRAGAVPQFEALDIQLLPLFLADYQGVITPGDSADQLFDRLEQLSCLPLSASLWEKEILPVRITPYHPSFLDTLMQEGELYWHGFDKQKVAFCLDTDFDLLTSEKDTTESDRPMLLDCFEDGYSRYDFTGLMDRSGMNSSDLSEHLWDAVWKGVLANDTFLAMRKGIETGFQFSNNLKQNRSRSRQRRRPSLRGGFNKWQGALPLAGHWYLTPVPDKPENSLEAEELNKERVRLLLDRYGILFRELLQKEIPAFQWASVFRSLRIMELSGEVLGGYFFKEIQGPQFISQKAFRKLSSRLPDQAIYWLCAVDPASVCGIAVSKLKQNLPKRLSGTHLVYKGSRLMMVSERNGKSLSFYCQPDDENLPMFLAPLSHMINRRFSPLNSIGIETINGELAVKSEFLPVFETLFDTVRDAKKLTLYSRHI